MAKILLVEDDTTLAGALCAYLSQENYTVEAVESGEDALQLLAAFEYDVVVLDWNLPGITGEVVCNEYRKRNGQASIIFLTGQNDISFLEKGLDVGADDYLTKPFEVRELAARLRSLLRRRRSSFESELRVLNLWLKPEKNVLLADEQQEVVLRPKETALLEYFIRNPNRIFSAQNLLDAVWASESTASSNTVRTWMGLLRGKLAPLGHENLIRTVPGAGYIMEKKAD